MTAFPLAGDDITAQTVGEFVLDGLLSDKVTSGLGITSNTSTNEITVDAGTAGVSHSDRLYRVELESQTTEAFATTSGTNYVYLAFDDSSGAVSVEVVDTQGAVADPALLIAEVDGSTGDVTPRNDSAELGDATGGDVVFDSVSTDKADITNETYIEASRNTATSTTTAGDFVNIIDTIDEDNLSELNGSQQFVPTETGKYDIVLVAGFNGGGTEDLCAVRIQDVDNGNSIGPQVQYTLVDASNFETLIASYKETLSAGVTYEFQATDRDSSYELTDQSIVRVSKGFSQP